MLHFSTHNIHFDLEEEQTTSEWLQRCVREEGKFLGTVTFVYCSDDYLLEKNQSYLDHDTYTDIITFDYCEGDVLNGDILISIDRVRENSEEHGVKFNNELQRVMAHGLLHLSGYGDKTDAESKKMREKEEEWMAFWTG